VAGASQDTQLHSASQDTQLHPAYTALSGFAGFLFTRQYVYFSHKENDSHKNRFTQSITRQPNELQVQIQQLIENYGKNSVERRHRDGYYSGKLNQLNHLWQQFCDLDEEVQQATLPTRSEYSSRLVVLKELVEKYQKNLSGLHAN